MQQNVQGISIVGGKDHATTGVIKHKKNKHKKQQVKPQADQTFPKAGEYYIIGMPLQTDSQSTTGFPPNGWSIPENLKKETLEGLKESYTHQHEARFQKILDNAKNHINNDFSKNGVTGNEVIVFDIDETVLDNREYYFTSGEYDTNKWNSWMDKAKAPGLKPTVELMKELKAKGYKIALVTGRRETYKQQTIDNLQKEGIPFDEIYCKPDDYNIPTASTFKTDTRKMLEEQKGYRIIANIGDQMSDIQGSEVGFKLPNPIYNIP
ncbi:MAG: HAD family acid phosphatase [Cyanobacteriota bacterium]